MTVAQFHDEKARMVKQIIERKRYYPLVIFAASSKKSMKVEMLILSKWTFDRRLIEMGNNVSTSIFLKMRRLSIGTREKLAGKWHTSKSDLNKVNYRRISLSRKCRIKVASISPNRIHFHADRVPLLRKPRFPAT